jgi:hypothetical protein
MEISLFAICKAASYRRTIHSFCVAATLAVLASVIPILQPPTARAATSLCNAFGYKNVSARGSRATIGSSNPNLHGGDWSYNRVVAKYLSGSTGYFGEIGWWKTSSGAFQGEISTRNASGDAYYQFNYSQTSHSFLVQYDSARNVYFFAYDGILVAS